MQVSLNPNYYFKWDTKRVILFSKSTPLNGGYKDWCSFLHPLHVVILGVLSYEHDIDKAIVSIQKYVNVKREAIEHFISLLTENAECTHLTLSIGTITFPPYLLLLGNISHSQTDRSSIIERSLSIKNMIVMKILKIIFSIKRKMFEMMSYLVLMAIFNLSKRFLLMEKTS